jgi:REP element-mobilizing transposase RayT
MSEFIHKSHNVTVLLYHLVLSEKYRRAVLDAGVDRVIALTCAEIDKRYEINFLVIGSDEDHIHLLVQSVPIIALLKL